METPPKELVTRQHDETQVPEVCGIPSTTFQVVYCTSEHDVGPMYLKLNDTWHRFFLDAGVLFWEEGTAPDADDDLLDNDEYEDWGQKLGVVGVPLSEVVMKDSVLRLLFANGAEVVLKHMPFDDTTSIIRLTPAG